MELEEQLRDLSKYYLNERLVAATLVQLQKDMNGAGLVAELTSTTKATHALLQAEHLVADLLQQNTEVLFALLYRVDLPEAEVAVYLHPDFSSVPAKAIAQAILDRELKKVVIREYLSRKGG